MHTREYTQEALFLHLKKITDFSACKGVVEAKQKDASLKKLSECFLKVIEESKQREIPNYMVLVLGSPEFKLALETKTEGDINRGSYDSLEQRMSFAWPANLEDLINQHIPHEFWHAYQALVRSKGKDPKACVKAEMKEQSSFAWASQSAPFNTKDEQKDFKDALRLGEKRIEDYQALLLKEAALRKEGAKLSEKEQARLAKFNLAATVYRPRYHCYTLSFKSLNLAPTEDKEKLLPQLPDKFYLPEAAFYWRHFEIKGEELEFLGVWGDPQDPAKKGWALIKDYWLLKEHIETAYAETAKSLGPAGKEVVYLVEMDAYLAPNFRKVNKTFFPERWAWHEGRKSCNLTAVSACHFKAQPSPAQKALKQNKEQENRRELALATDLSKLLNGDAAEATAPNP